MLCLEEIVPGCVAYMDPEVLAKFGVPCTIEGAHPFVCLVLNDGVACWAALSSKPGRGRRLIDRQYKTGHSSWTERASYVYGFLEVWSAPAYVFQEASNPERSQRGERNGVTQEGVRWLRSLFGR